MRPPTSDALQDLRPEGRNTVIVFAAERALSDRPPSSQRKVRSELSRLGDALLQQQPPIALETLLDQLRSEDPAQRSAAEARKQAYENAQFKPVDAQYWLNTGIKALADIPRAQRMLTLEQALQCGIKGRALQTLLPEADQPLLQRMRDSEKQPDSDHAQKNLSAASRFGVALMIRGHGGLAAWLQMRQQPDGVRLADELRESIKNGPELKLEHVGKRRFSAATHRLLKYGLGDGGASTLRPPARTNAPPTRTPPREATGPADPTPDAMAVEPAMSWSIGSAFEAAAGPSAAVTSPTDSSWSLGVALERLGGIEGLDALLQQTDELSPARSPVASSSGPGLDAASASASASGALRHVPTAGRNTLIAYAAESALSNRSPYVQRHARSELIRFGDALLQQRPPIALEAFLDHLQSDDPAQRSAAEARRLTHVTAQGGAADVRSHLNIGIKALANVPRAQRMLTLEQALQRNIIRRSLQTLLPEADQPFLQRVRDSEREPDSDPAQRNLTALCRFGVALMVRGHGGLAAWLQMRQQPDGVRLAEELRESIKNGPELKLEHDGKRRFSAATGRLLKYGPVDDGASTSPPLARTDTPPAPIRPRGATGPSAAVASPPDSSSSLGAALERLGGPEGFDALLRQIDARPPTNSPVATSRRAGVDAAAAASSHPATLGAGPAGPRCEMPALLPRARNTLVAYAAHRALIDAGKPDNGYLRKHRTAFIRLGTALLQQHEMSLDTHLERLSSHDPAQRDDAAALQAAFVSEQSDPDLTRGFIGACINALNAVPPERRMLTPGEALRNTRLKAAELVTLLPEADHGLLQKRLASEKDPSGRTALRKQSLLVRLGVALMSEGQGGLTGWVQLHRQTDGPRLAGELLDRLKNGPELGLSARNKEELARAAGQLRECGLGAPGAGTSEPRAAVDTDIARTGPQAQSGPAEVQPHDDPLLDFADSLERSLRSPSPAEAGSPRNDATEDFALPDPGAPTADDLTFIDSLDLTGRGLYGTARWHDDPLHGLDDSPQHPPTGR